MVQKPESEGGWEITLEQGSWIGKTNNFDVVISMVIYKEGGWAAMGCD